MRIIRRGVKIYGRASFSGEELDVFLGSAAITEGREDACQGLEDLMIEDSRQAEGVIFGIPNETWASFLAGQKG